MPQTRYIIVVDDERHIRHLLQINLERAGYDVLAVASGVAAFDAVRQRVPDVLVSDYVMPGEMNGIELFKAVRAEKGLGELPLLMLTGSTTVNEVLSDEVAALSNADIIFKPFSPKAFLRRIQEMIGDVGASQGGSGDD